MKRSFRIIVEYDGTDFHGWQIQPGLRTVQGELEKALEIVTGKKVRVSGAGRTDAGVHAIGQVASFALEECSLPAGRILAALNALTSEDITVHSIVETPDKRIASDRVVSKTYRYYIDNGRNPSPLRRRTHFHIACPLDVFSMNMAAKILEGQHDFSAMRATDCTDPDPVKTIERCEVAKEDSVVTIEVTGSGFLKHMVRIIAGTLIHVGKGKIEPQEVGRILDSRDRTKAGPTAPARGLVLVTVNYG